MAGGYDLLLGWPNLGQPCLVHRAKGQDITFPVLFYGKINNLDVKSLLEGKLYLQSLSDTRQIIQDEIIKNVKDMGDVPCRLKRGLIPIKIEKVERPIEIVENPVIRFPYAYWVTLRVESQYLRCLKLPQLFNLIQDSPFSTVLYRLPFVINFHSVYIHEKEWHDFKFIQASDTHIAWRNDHIPRVIAKKMPGHPISYVNPNKNFRKFITYANTLYRKGELDFILLTGDIIDYIWGTYSNRYWAEEWMKKPGPWWMKERPPNNFCFFKDLVIAWARWEGEVLGDELEVPLFTVLGNHDYRENEYPLVFWIEPFWNINWEKTKYHESFVLTEQEAIAFEEAVTKESGIPEYDKDECASFVSYCEGAEVRKGNERGYVYPWPALYTSEINPNADYVIQLGKHRIVCLDSAHDEGVVTGILQWLFKDESEADFLAGAPDSAGFSKEQIAFLENQIRGAEGLVIVAFHAPMVNIRKHTPGHLLRETEHKKSSTGLIPCLAETIPNFADYYMSEDEYGEWELEEEKLNKEWPLGKTRYFKVGERDPVLGYGVTDHRFKEFMQVITKKIGKNKVADLILAGHTHRNIEYRVTLGNDGLVRYYHDYYIDNTVHGQKPQDKWRDPNVPDYPEPLSEIEKRSTDPKEWWRQHRPLFVQTLCLGPKPSEDSQPEVGVLLIKVQNDVITNMKRVYLNEMKKEKPAPIPTPIPDQAYFILATSPP